MQNVQLRFPNVSSSLPNVGFLRTKSARLMVRAVLILAAIFVAAVLVWQGIAAHGAPDPTHAQGNKAVAIFDIGVLVFREGLESILVLSAIVASMVGLNAVHRRPVAVGAGLGFSASVITWFIAVGIVSNLSDNVPALDLQAGTGLLAVVVLLIVMNWFFHKVYWGGWIGMHNRHKKNLLSSAEDAEITERRLMLGLGLLGFASVYREGFEVVLFLQGYNLQMGGNVVLFGTLIGLFLSGVVAVLTFLAHKRLPYRKMLILTGTMLGFVLLVMVGEQAQEMQFAGWIPTTKINWLENFAPDWMGVWFSFYPTVETVTAQMLAAVLVIGSYYAARKQSAVSRRETVSRMTIRSN
jgi:high-affinity iron transporter